MKKSDTGFTLIEVLIALAILAIALVAAIKIAGQSVNTTSHLKDKVAAHLVAMNVLSELQVGMIDFIGQSEQAGISDMFGKVWRWQATFVVDSRRGYERVLISIKSLHQEKPIASLTGYILNTKKSKH